MAWLHFLGKNKRPAALDHKVSKSRKYNGTVLKTNANLGCNDRNTISEAREVIVQGPLPSSVTSGLCSWDEGDYPAEKGQDGETSGN